LILLSRTSGICFLQAKSFNNGKQESLLFHHETELYSITLSWIIITGRTRFVPKNVRKRSPEHGVSCFTCVDLLSLNKILCFKRNLLFLEDFDRFKQNEI